MYADGLLIDQFIHVEQVPHGKHPSTENKSVKLCLINREDDRRFSLTSTDDLYFRPVIMSEKKNWISLMNVFIHYNMLDSI